MAGHAGGEVLIIGVGRVLERNPVPSQHVHRAVDVLGREGDVLDAFAVILAQVLLDLALVVLRLVDRDADLAARTGHGARQEPGALALDVEVADLAEAEQLLVEAGPDIHAPAADVVRQMVDQGEACSLGRRALGHRARHRAKIHVIDRALAVQVDQVDERAADALDAGDVELHGTGALRSGPGPQLQRPAERGGRVAHPERHGARRGTMRARERLCEGLSFRVDDEVDLTLAVQGDVLGAMARDHREPQPLEQRAQQLRIRGRVLDEFEAIRAHRVVMRVAHQFTSRSPRLAGTRNPIRRISSENFGSPRSRSNSGSELSSIRSGSPSWYARSSHSNDLSLSRAAA